MLYGREVMNKFQGSKLRLARHYWGKTLTDVANDISKSCCEISKSRQYVSALEIGSPSKISEDILESLCLSLKVEPNFFHESLGTLLTEDQAHFRSLSTTKVSTRLKVLARGAVFEQLANLIDHYIALPEVNFPDFSGAHTLEELERSAEKARIYWGLGLGPIDNMVKIVEHAGALVTFFKDASQEVDALSIPAKRPVIVRNDAKESPLRQRFDIAHEMAHLVLHNGIETGDRKTETEANRMASAFLMPRSSFSKAFKTKGLSLDWKNISEVKELFGVSKAAIIYRAKVLGLITDRQYVSGAVHLKNSGQSKKENEDDMFKKERSLLINKSFDAMEKHYGMGFSGIAKRLNVSAEFLDAIVPDVYSRHLDARITYPRLRLVK